jgi:HupE/UreJ protein
MHRQMITIHLLRLAKWGMRLAILSIVVSTSEQLIFGHTTSISYSEILIQEETVQVRLRLNLYEVSFAAQLDGNSDRVLSDAEVRNSFPRWVHKVFDCIQIEGRGETGKASLGEFKFAPDTGALECLLSYSFSQVLEEVRLRVTLHNLTDSGHLNLALVQYNSQQEQRFFNLENTETRIEVHRGWMSFLKLWTRWLLIGGSRVISSYECVAFLFGLLLVGQGLRSRAKVTGAFLLSQTLTFLLGAFNLVVLPQKFVGSAIALSVAYISIENLLIKELSNRWLIALFFGLIYGFSFSSTAAGWALPQKGMLFSLLTISLGIVLAASILAALASLFLHHLGRLRFHRHVITLASMILMSFGFLSFARRTF